MQQLYAGILASLLILITPAIAYYIYCHWVDRRADQTKKYHYEKEMQDEERKAA
ncbi:MAG TPA: hypothetical protein VIH99_10315 [Bdellovibrionota bacterium]|jgi:hypothetical protein